jgi:hypothetical protein
MRGVYEKKLNVRFEGSGLDEIMVRSFKKLGMLNPVSLVISPMQCIQRVQLSSAYSEWI